jgi:SAM-dependent methyltransferase
MFSVTKCSSTLIPYVKRNLHYALPWEWRAGAIAVYRRLAKNGMMLTADDVGAASLNPARTVERILSLMQPKSVLDVGCGTGRTLRQLCDRGIDAVGIEASSICIRASDCSDLIVRGDLRYPVDLKRHFDLVWCFEVAEHIYPCYADIFLDTLAKHGNLIAMSAAPPGQGGIGHFNEQPKSYWIDRMAKRGFSLHEPFTAELMSTDERFAENMMVFSSDHIQAPKSWSRSSPASGSMKMGATILGNLPTP